MIKHVLCPTATYLHAGSQWSLRYIAQIHGILEVSFSLRRFKPLAYNLFTTRRLYNYAFQILLTASVMPTSFVSNSYNETPTNIVVTRSIHIRRFLITGTRLFGK